MLKNGLTFPIFFNNFIICAHCINSSNISSKGLLYFDLITRTYFENEKLLLIRWSDAILGFQEEVIEYCASSGIVTVETCDCDRPSGNSNKEPAKNIAILFGGVVVTSARVKMIKNCQSWNGRAKIIILINGNDTNVVHDAVDEIWATTKAVNIAIMLTTNSSVQMFKYYPYSTPKIEETTRVHNLYDNKIPQNFNGSVIYVAATDSVPYVLKPAKHLEYTEGLEVRIINAISQNLNFKVKYKESPNGENPWINRAHDGRIIGLFGLLHRGEADILFHGLRIREDRITIADVTSIHTFDDLVWVYPKKLRSHKWKNLFVIFKPELWISILIIIFLNTTTVHLLRKFNHGHCNSANSHTFSDCFFTIIAQILTNTTNFTLNNNPYRIFMFSVFLFALNITSAYQSYLIMSLSSAKSEQVYQTIRDAVNGGLIAYLYPSAKSKFNKTDHDLWNVILSPGNHIWTDNYTNSLHVTAYNKSNYGEYILNLAEFEINSKYLDKEGKSIMHIEKKLREPYWACMFTSRWHPLTELLSVKLLRLFDAGLIRFFMNDINRKYRMKGDAGEGVKSGPKALSLSDLQGAFILGLILLIFSMFVFGCEVLIMKKKWGVKLRKRKKC